MNDFVLLFPVPVRAREFDLARQVRSSRPASACSFSTLRLREWLDRRRAKQVLSPCAIARITGENREFFKKKLVSDYNLIPSHDSQPEGAIGQDSWGAVKGDSGLLLARALVSQLKASTTMDLGTAVFLVLHEVTLAFDQTDQSGTLPFCWT